MPDTPIPNPAPPKPSESRVPQKNTPSPAGEQEEKLNPALWAILFVGAGIVDLTQLGLEALVIGVVLNLLIDIFVGLSLGTFFIIRGMTDWRLMLSVFLGFAADFLTDGILPAWIMDIGYAWLITDGSRTLSQVPIVGEKAKQIAVAALQKGKSGAGGGAVAGLSAEEQAASSKLQAIGSKAQTGAERTVSAVRGKSVDGIKPGTGSGGQKTALSPGEKPPILSQQNPPQSIPQTSSAPYEKTGGGGSGGQQKVTGEKKDDKNPGEENKDEEDKKESGGEGEKKEGEENDDKSKESDEKKKKEEENKKENQNKNNQNQSNGSRTSTMNSGRQNQDGFSGTQTATGGSGGGTNGGEQPQNPPRYGVDREDAREHPFISGIDAALGVKEKND